MSEHDLDPVDALRDQFRAAAARDIAGQAPTPVFKRRRWRGRIAVIATIAIAGTAGLAVGGNQLISTGEPKPEIPGKAKAFQPTTTPQVVLLADDDSQPLPWGVALYRGRNGQQCALAGHANGGQIGVVEHDQFRPYADDYSGVCTDFSELPMGGTEAHIDGRLLLYGIAEPGVESMRLAGGDRRYDAEVGTGGAWLFVFPDAAHFSQAGLRMTARDADGNVVQQ